MRRLTPINQLPSRYQDNVIRQGDVLSFARGSRIFLEGSDDEYVHYLLEGRVAMLINGFAARYLSGNSDTSAYPLDEGGKERTCTASVEEAAKVFRIEHAALQRQIDMAASATTTKLDEVIDITEVTPSTSDAVKSSSMTGSPVMPEPADTTLPDAVTIKRLEVGEDEGVDESVTAASVSDSTEIAPADPEFYSDTQYGQGLAALVEEIRSDSEKIANQPVADRAETTLTGTTELNLGDEFFDLEFGQSESTAAIDESPQARTPEIAESATQDWISKAFKESEDRFREQLESALVAERAHAEQLVQERVAHVGKRAEEMIRERLVEARARDKERIEALEAQLRERYGRLEQVANKITHQKAEIQRARRHLEQKLHAAAELHRELSTLGQTMTQQIDNLEEMMPDEGAGLSR